MKRRTVLGGFDPERYQTERLWVTSRHQRREDAPFSLVSRKGGCRDGSGPLWLYGYGSYGLGEVAAFAASASACWSPGA